MTLAKRKLTIKLSEKDIGAIKEFMWDYLRHDDPFDVLDKKVVKRLEKLLKRMDGNFVKQHRKAYKKCLYLLDQEEN